MSAVMSCALLPIEIRNHTAAFRRRRKYPDCMLRHTRASTALPEPIPIAGCGYPLAGQAGLEPATSAYVYAATLPSELLSHITSGTWLPEGGLCLLSALDRLGDSHFWQRWGIFAPGGRGGIRTRDTRFCRPLLSPLSYADHVPGFRRAEEKGKKVIARFRAGASAGL